MRTVSDSETDCYIKTLQKEQLWKLGIKNISVNKGYKDLKTLGTYPNIKRENDNLDRMKSGSLPCTRHA
jgi:hypothetical protein